MAHTQRDREKIIQVALERYNTIIGWSSGNPSRCSLEDVLNEMNNVYIMVARWNTKGNNILKQTIFECEKRLELLR